MYLMDRISRLFGSRKKNTKCVPPAQVDVMRRCRYEPLEDRKLLAADIEVGAVYYEEASGQDQAGDLLEVTFQGGEPGTQLSQLVIETDKMDDGLTIGDVLFDTAPTGTGAFDAFPPTILQQNGIDNVDIDVNDGGTTLTLNFEGFDPGDRLLLSIDVDEQGFLGPNAVAEGNEFEGSILTTTFRAPHFFDATGADIFIDAFDSKLAASGLDLPDDDYSPPNDTPHPVRTAGAFLALSQEPLPISLSGSVYEDLDLDNVHDAGETGIAGVNLELLVFDGTDYVSTGQTTTTSAAGDYQFDDLEPGKYQVVETQPAGWFSVGAAAGTVDGATRGTVLSPNVISEVELLGGEDSIDNDFGETGPATLSGNVYHDRDNDGHIDAGEEGIGGVTIEVQQVFDSGSAPAPIVTQTAADGSWSVTGLAPGKYVVREIQPNGFLDGLDTPGDAGGSAQNPGDEISGIMLVGNQTGMQYNFGELLPVEIHGRVHTDLDGDCRLDAGESPIAGVTIHLLDEAGSRIATTTTDQNGEYWFTGLRPGTYGIEEIQPGGFFQGGQTVGTAGGVIAAADRITGVQLSSGEQGTGYNFCEHPPASIWGNVYADDNNNGAFDAGEQGIAGVTLSLLDENGDATGTTTVTAADGSYHFENLAPGKYGIAETQPAGFFDGRDSAGSAGGVVDDAADRITMVMLAPGEMGMNYNFGELRPASIAGNVFADDNDNGVFDSGEQGIGGVTLALLKSGVSTGRTTTTAADGSYLFDNLDPGDYGVVETQPNGFFDGKDSAGSAGGTAQNPGDRISGAIITPGLAAVEYNFGELRPGGIHGRVHTDLDGDCELDGGESPLAGVTIHLLNDLGERIDTTTTDANGEYWFENLEPGTYGIEEEQPAGFFQGGQVIGSAGGLVLAQDRITNITIGSGESGVGYNFCEHPPASIWGNVYADDNDNGVFDAGEQGLGGVTVSLLDENGDPTGRTTVTAADGSYHFDNLSPGKYGVAETQPTGFFDGRDSAGSLGGVVDDAADRITMVMLAPGEMGMNYNFGELRPASISGSVFADDNDDGVFDSGEQGIAGVTLTLLDSGVSTGRTTVTAADGSYRFDNLAPGEYGVAETQPEGFFDGQDSAGSAGGTAQNPGDQISGAVLMPGLAAVDYNFGELRPASISGFVFQDGSAIVLDDVSQFNPEGVRAFRDGAFTSDDEPLAGVTLQLGNFSGEPVLDSAGRPITTTTDSRGFYQFTGLRSGVYTVLQVQPEEFIDGIDTAGTTGGIAVNPGDSISPQLLSVDHRFDAIARIPVAVGQQSLNNNFSEVLLTERPPEEPPRFFPRVPGPTLPETPTPTLFPLPENIAPVLAPSVIVARPTLFLDGGSGVLGTYTWHLSVIDAGNPRGPQYGYDPLVQVASRFNWHHGEMALGQWDLYPNTDEYGDDIQHQERRHVQFGIENGIPVTGDWNGDGQTEVGVYREGEWFLDLNGNGFWDEDDLWAQLGDKGDLPVTGDWNGDGKTDIGIFGPEWPGDPRALAAEPGLPDPDNAAMGPEKNLPPRPHEATMGTRKLRLTSRNQMREDLIDHVFHYGTPGDRPITGDWNGDGTDSIGVFREGNWFLDVNGNGRWDRGDRAIRFGQTNDLPVVGDFDGDGVDDMGLYRRGVFYLDMNHDQTIDAHDQVLGIGQAGDMPVVGDWDGDGIDDVGVHRASAAPAEPSTGDTAAAGG